MQINNMLPFLINILSRQEIQSSVSKTPTGKEAGTLPQQTVEQALETVAAGIDKSNRDDVSVTRQNSPVQTLPDFLPLPLKSPLFTESSFFIKNNRKDSGEQQADSGTEVFLRLRTENLGLIWISLTSRNEYLKVSFFSEDPSYTNHLQEDMPTLMKDLNKLGYPSVTASAFTRQGIRHCADIRGTDTTAEFHLIDREV